MPKLFRPPPLATTQVEPSGTQASAPAPFLCRAVQWVAVGILALGLTALLGLLLTFHTLQQPVIDPPAHPPAPPGVSLTPPPATAPPLSSPLPPGPVTLLPPPPNGTEIVRLAHGSCAHQGKEQHFWNAMRARSPQLFIFNGDLVYGDCKAEQCPELTDAWERLFANENMRAAAAELPMVGMLDDHDYGQNDCFEDNPWKHFAKAEYLRRFGAAPRDARRAREGLYQSLAFGPAGRRLQVILLDTRWSRSPFLPTDCPYCTGKERYVAYNDSGAERSADSGGAPLAILGEEQWGWLEEQLSEPADLRLLFSTVQVLAQGHGWERWGLIPSELRRLQALIAATEANGVVLLSGDRHVGGLYKLPAGRGGGVPYDLYEVTSSSLTHSYRLEPGAPEKEPGVGDEAAAGTRLGALVHQNHFGTVSVDWDAREVTLELVASDDCGLAAQAWGEQCVAHEGAAGQTLKGITLGIDELSGRRR